MSGPSVVCFAADFAGTGHYRIRWPAAELARQGYPVRVLEKCSAAAPPRADVIVLQCPVSRNAAELVSRWRGAGRRVVVEIDDNYRMIPPGHSRFGRAPGETGPPRDHGLKDWAFLDHACRTADAVVASTPELAEPYGGRVVENYLPEQFRAEPRITAEPVIGWAGNPRMHAGDLLVTGGAVGRVCRETGAGFHHFGTEHEMVREQLELDKVTSTTEWLPTTRFARGYNGMSIGIVPLRSNGFNRGKSAIKGLEMSARAIPFVCTPIPSYFRLHYAGGLGAQARTPDDWLYSLSALVLSDERRRHLGDRARLEALERYMLRDNAWRFWEAWTT